MLLGGAGRRARDEHEAVDHALQVRRRGVRVGAELLDLGQSARAAHAAVNRAPSTRVRSNARATEAGSQIASTTANKSASPKGAPPLASDGFTHTPPNRSAPSTAPLAATA